MKNLKNFYFAVLTVFFISGATFAQTNPAPFDLSSGNFTFSGFADGTTTTYPASMQGHSFSAEPAAANILTSPSADRVLVVSTSAIATGSIRNEVANGISLLNSGTNNIGAIVVGLNTTGRNNITVNFTAQQLNDGTTRVNGLRLQYRIGTSGDFTDVSPTTEYLSLLSGTNAAQNFTNIALPAAVDNQPVVQVRWIYYTNSGSGGRDRIRLDDIAISSSSSVTDTDLTVSRTVDVTTAALNDTVTYTLTVANSGMSGANNVRTTFVVPAGLTFSSSTVNGGFTASETGGTVTFDGGTVSSGGSVVLTVSTTATTEGAKAISATSDITVDPNNTITETNETNNNANDTTETRLLFPATVVGLSGRPSLAQLMTDIADIGGANLVVLNSDLIDENAPINVPDLLTIDFGLFTVSGTGAFLFGDSCGIRTSHPNGVGDASHPGNIQTTGQNDWRESTDFTFYVILTIQQLGTIGGEQTAYGMPESIGTLRINHPNGVNIIAPLNLNEDLFLTNGIIYNGANTISLSQFSRINGDNNGEGTQTSFVAGKMQKYFPFTGTVAPNGIPVNFVFPVGTVGGADDGYSPIKAQNFSANIFDSSLTVEVFDMSLPGVTTPGITRYWQITETGDVMTDLNFNWRAGEDSAVQFPETLSIYRNAIAACAGNCTINFAGRTATITGVSDFSPWGVAQLAPLANNAVINGRVLTNDGRGLRNAFVRLTKPDGTTIETRTGTFGYYQFADVEVGQTYIVSVQSKRFQFAPRAVQVNDNISDLDFIAVF